MRSFFLCIYFIFFFFKQKTAYEMRISDWSSDVCSSDLESRQRRRHLRNRLQQQRGLADTGVAADQHHRALDQATAEHPVELADAGAHARVLVVAHVLERGHLRRVYLAGPSAAARCGRLLRGSGFEHDLRQRRSEEHTSELQSLMRISY